MTAEKLYTVQEASESLGISPLTLGKWLREGKITGTKLGKLWRITETDLQNFIEKNRQV